MTANAIPVVFDLETGGDPFPIGRYDHTDEDAVIYYTAAGERRAAPCDCVQVVMVDVFAPVVRDPESWQAVAREGRRFA